MGSIGNQVPQPLLEQHAEPHVAGQGSLAAPSRRVRAAAAAGSSAADQAVGEAERRRAPCSTPGTSVAALAALAGERSQSPAPSTMSAAGTQPAHTSTATASRRGMGRAATWGAAA